MPQHPFLRFLILLSTCTLPVSGFYIPHRPTEFDFLSSCQGRHSSKLILSVANNDSGRDILPQSSSDEDKALYKELQQRHEEMQIEKTRNALEEQNTKSFLKKRPVKLPYEQARKWVQANLGVNTKEEFEDFVTMGYIQTPYIPKNPEQYYTRTRDWISWDHFLNEFSMAIEPQRGVFD
jgi:hypothetical protein